MAPEDRATIWLAVALFFSLSGQLCIRYSTRTIVITWKRGLVMFKHWSIFQYLITNFNVSYVWVFAAQGATRYLICCLYDAIVFNLRCVQFTLLRWVIQSS
jgi:hypothetical protein